MINVQPNGDVLGGYELVLTPRERFKSKKALNIPVLYAHSCPVCGNLIQAVFMTKTLIDTYPFEEVSVLDTEDTSGNPVWGETRGQVKEILPNDKHKRRISCYNVVYDATLGYQKIVLKNHILKMKAGVQIGHHTGENLKEPGVKPCFYMGLTSFKEDVLVRDFLFFSHFKMDKVKGIKLPTLDFIAPPTTGSESIHMRVPTYGRGPQVVLVRKHDLMWGFDHELDPIWDKHVAELPKQEKANV